MLGSAGRRAIGGSVAFSPSDLAAVKYWIDAGAIQGVADGGAIATTNVLDRSRFQKGALTLATNLTYRLLAGSSRPAIEFNGVDSVARSPSFTQAQACTVFAVMKQINWQVVKRFWDGNTTNKIWSQSTGLTPRIGMGTGGGATVPVDQVMDVGYVTMVECVYNSTSSTIRTNNNNTSTADSGTTGTTDGFAFGAAGSLNAGFFANYQLLEWLVCDSTLSSTQKQQIRDYLTTKHRLITRRAVVYDGNSLTSGNGASNAQLNGTGTDYPSQCHQLLGGDTTTRHLNIGVPSQTTLDMSSDAVAQVDTKALTFARPVCAAWEITNHIILGGADATTAYNAFVSYCQGRQAAGFKVIAVSVLPRVGFTAPMIVIKDAVNVLLRANWPTFADGFYDAAADARLSDFTNATYFHTDQTHLVDAGYAVVAAGVASEVARLAPV